MPVERPRAISVVGDDQRRQEAHDIVAGGDRQQLLGARGGDEVGVRHVAA